MSKATQPDWSQLVSGADFTVEDDGVRVQLAHGRVQCVSVLECDDHYILKSLVAKRASLEALDEAPLVWAWRQNRGARLYYLHIDQRGRLIGEANVPKLSLTSEEFRVYVLTLARACDAMEYNLTGADREQKEYFSTTTSKPMRAKPEENRQTDQRQENQSQVRDGEQQTATTGHIAKTDAAPVQSCEILFKCTRCNSHYCIGQKARGMQVACRNCSQPIDIPIELIEVRCPRCPTIFTTPLNCRGETFHCPTCRAPAQVPTSPVSQSVSLSSVPFAADEFNAGLREAENSRDKV